MAGPSITSSVTPATGLLWAGGGGEWHGAGVWCSEDAGETWQVAKLTKGIARHLPTILSIEALDRQ
jgi:hypothetical protein